MHVHVTLREEPNPVWAEDRAEWEIPADDPATAGGERMMKFRRRVTAERWIERTFREEFTPETHELVYARSGERWTYADAD
jgi:hypothetical protein